METIFLGFFYHLSPNVIVVNYCIVTYGVATCLSNYFAMNIKEIFSVGDSVCFDTLGLN